MTGDVRFTYADAGVDIRAAESLTNRLSALAASTRSAEVSGNFGSFGARFRLEGDPELVASADGVGTKVLVARMAGRHDTVGEDLVNHCVNDILTEGAEPLFFMDYFACGRLDTDVAFDVVSGIARGCRENGCALLGGETAEMPGMYSPEDYDLAGFSTYRGEGRWRSAISSSRCPRPGSTLTATVWPGVSCSTIWVWGSGTSFRARESRWLTSCCEYTSRTFGLSRPLAVPAESERWPTSRAGEFPATSRGSFHQTVMR